MDDFTQLMKNCKEYGKHSKYREVLVNADGKSHYSDIAKKVQMHATKVSSALKLAEKLGLATKNKKGLYHKKAGVLGYISKVTTKEDNSTSGSNIVKKITNSNKKSSKPTGAAVSNRIANSANKMVNAYNHLYYTENTLRELIRKVMIPVPNWWNVKVPIDVRDSVTKEMARAPYHAAPRHDELEHTHLADLRTIITKNWGMFVPFMNEKEKAKFITIIDRAIPHRNAIGHCIPLTGEDSRYVEMRFQDILKMIK